MWDAEVDVACIGAGIGGLATAVAGVDEGGEVMVAEVAPDRLGDAAAAAVSEHVVTNRTWVVPDTLDAETNDYFSALTDGVVAESMDLVGDAPVPVRVVCNLSGSESSQRTVEPFVGSRLNDWAGQCLSSPYGMLHSNMRYGRTTPMRSSDGESIDVILLGTVEWTDGSTEGTLSQWMSAQALQRDIEVRTISALQRLVFSDGGDIVGVVLSTADGPYAVRARVGVSLAPPAVDSGSGGRVDQLSGDRLHVCIVGRTASRFGRVELLTTAPAPTAGSASTSASRLREARHELRAMPSEGLRSGKVHRYPPRGQ